MESQTGEAKASNEEVLELMADFATAIEAAAIQLKHEIGKNHEGSDRNYFRRAFP